MPDSKNKGHSKIRTFAQDFNAQQEKRGTPVQPTVSEEVKKQPEAVPMAKAPSATTEQKPVVVKPVEKKAVVAPEPEVIKPIEKSKETPKASIPSFHDLQEEVAAIQVPTAEKPKTETSKEFTGKKPVPSTPARTNIGYDSKVITDTKHKRFKLFPAIGASLSSWFKSVTKPRKKKTPSYLVPDADRRKGVIQKATSKSGSVFTADSSDLKEKIRLRQLREEDERKAEAQEAREPETTWSPYTDIGYNLLDEGEEAPVSTAPKSVTIEYKKQPPLEEANRWNTAVPESEPKLVPVIENEPTPEIVEPVEIPEPELVEATQPEITEPSPEPEMATATQTPAETPVAIIEPISTDHSENEVVIKDERRYGINRLSTNTLTLALLALGVAIVITVLVARPLMNTNQTSPVEVYTDETQPIAGAQLVKLTVTDSQSLLRQIDDSTIAQDFGFVDVQVYTPSGQIVPPTRVLELMQFQVLPSFSQSLTDVRFVYLNQSKPIVVFTFVDEETILGGFLAWESTMHNDLRLIYDLPLTQTTSFTDQTVNGIDVRVLLSETGQTLVVYGMINENTALLTNSLTDFTQVIESSF